MYEQERKAEIQSYRAKFAHVDITDPKSLYKWLNENRHLTIGALATIAQVPRSKIRVWQKLAGIIKKPGQHHSPKVKPVSTTTIINPPLPGHKWGEIEWLSDAYERTHSTSTIAKVADVSSKRVEQKLRQYGLYKPKPIHPCNNEEWLKLHFVQQANSARECARLASVSHNCMLDWLAKHGIASHSNEQMNFSVHRKRPTRTPLWFKVLAGKLQEQDVVRNVSLQELGMTVRYETGVLEMYFAIPYYKKYKRGGRTFSLDTQNSRFDKQVEVHRQFPVNFGDLEYNHFMINRSDWEAASLMERRVALHRFQLKQRAEDMTCFPYPEEQIDHCLQCFAKLNPNNYIKDNIFLLHSKTRWTASNCWPVVFTYFNLWSDIGPFFKSPRKFLSILNIMTKHSCALNTESMLRFACHRYGLRLTSPVGYRAIFEHLGLRRGGVLLDLQPGVGCKAVACSLIGASYRTRPNQSQFDNASVLYDFDRKLGLDWDWHRGESVDMVMADNEFRDVNVEFALDTYKALARRIVCHVKAENRDEYEKRFKPRAVVGIRTCAYRRAVSYLFVW